MPLVLDCKKSSNIFLVIRHTTCSRQKSMAEKLGVDIKKFRELEKDRCLPDSEIIWKLYNLFHISPAVVLKDKNSMHYMINTFCVNNVFTLNSQNNSVFSKI